MVNVVWFKRDLRLQDHPALVRAAGQGPVLPLYILEPGYWRQPDVSGRQFAFLTEAVDSLAQEIAALGGALCLRVGETVAVLAALQAQTPITAIHTHEETGNGWTFARDRAVTDWARRAGVALQEVPQCGVVRRLKTRDVWSAQRDRFMAQPPLDVPYAVDWVRAPSDAWPASRALGLAPDPCPGRQIGGRARAERALSTFLTERGRSYRRDMSSPLTGATACSRLSPHLALGTMSIREVVHRTADRQTGTQPRDGWAQSLHSFQSRLAWRDHFLQKLEDEPAIEDHAMHPAFEDARPDADPALLDAWCTGRTGFPFLDACMRSLDHTGWLNFRMRAMVMSFASYHLWLPWRATGLHLARQFTDYEPGIHWSQVQMQSGTTGINTPRIYNPVKQGLDQDSTGAFTRRWLPELAQVPDAFLQEPWRWDGRADYPAPIVDLAEAGCTARARLSEIRRGAGFQATAQKVITRHASRKDRGRHFVNDRAPRKRRAKPDTQLSLDL